MGDDGLTWYEARDAEVARLGDEDLVSGIEYRGGGKLHPTDIESIDASWDSGGDEPDFVWLLKLKDGRWAAASGWHDYTGWDCQAGFDVSFHATREEAIRFGLTLNERDHLGLLLPEDQIPDPEAAS